ncbi:MAG: AAA family ATPase [Planctomycetes bacterium]|nr:AAA family ATPase [Planctomycetota bacterium]
MKTPDALARDVAEFPKAFSALRDEIGRVFLGAPATSEALLCALFAGGHVLLEGAPGLGKTTLVQGVADALELSFRRIQFTPDLMPADITGTRVLDEDERGARRFVFHRGPVFANVLLADEINRATPRTQSALLEAMQEGQVTVFGERFELERPFFVAATQNPIEMEGTYPLPEAQLDRFLFKLDLGAPDLAALTTILSATTGEERAKPKAKLDRARLLAMQSLVRQVPASRACIELVARTLLATDPASPTAPDLVRRYVRYGASPRGGQALLLGAKVRALAAGELHVRDEDLTAWIAPALRHRLVLNYEGEAARARTDELALAAFERARKG